MMKEIYYIFESRLDGNRWKRHSWDGGMRSVPTPEYKTLEEAKEGLEKSERLAIYDFEFRIMENILVRRRCDLW